MKEEQAVTASEESDVKAVTTLSAEEQAAIDALMQGSGETEQSKGFVSIPVISVDNRMVEVEIPSATPGVAPRKTKARCEPSFTLQSKVGDEYVTELFSPDFEAVILKFKHRVQRKYIQDQQGTCLNKMKFWRSLEFASFNSPIHIRQDGEFLHPMSYQEVKAWAGDENELWGVVYFIIKGENTVRKAEFKGASRGVLYDYMTADRPRSISSYYTKFSVEEATDAAQPYNKLKLELIDGVPDNLVQLAAQQKELNEILDRQSTPSKPAVSGTVMGGVLGTGKEVADGHSFDDGVKVENIPFD